MHRIFNYWCQKISQSFNFRHFTPFSFIVCIILYNILYHHHLYLLLNPVLPFLLKTVWQRHTSRFSYESLAHTRYKKKFNAIIMMWRHNCTIHWDLRDKFCMHHIMKTLPSIAEHFLFWCTHLTIQSFIIMTNCLWRHFRYGFWCECISRTCLLTRLGTCTKGYLLGVDSCPVLLHS